MRHHNHRAALLQLANRRLNRGRARHIERRARLIEQQHVGLKRQRARDAQTLLLAAGKLERAAAHVAVDLAKQAHHIQIRLGGLAQAPTVPHSAKTQAISNIPLNRKRKRRGLLHHEPHAGAQLVGAQMRRFLAAQKHVTAPSRPGHVFDRAVQTREQRRLSAARRPDNRRDATPPRLERHIAQHLPLAVKRIHFRNAQRGLGLRCGP